MENISFYCINFLNEERKNKIIERFSNFQISVEFVPPVFTTDERLPHDIIKEEGEKRIWAIMLQHLDSIRHFYETTENEYLIVCEDDILLSKDFKEDLPKIIQDFEDFKLDILLLGYLFDISFELNKHHPHIIESNTNHLNTDFVLLQKPQKYNYYHFPYHIWGSQMYLIHRKHAKFLIDKYTIEYGINDRFQCHFNPDWTLTKDKNHAILYPMIALEEGGTNTDHVGQNIFHKTCFLKNYRPDIFL